MHAGQDAADNGGADEGTIGDGAKYRSRTAGSMSGLLR